MTKLDYYLLVLIVVILSQSFEVAAIRKQNVRVRAAFTCGQEPARNAHAVLIEADSDGYNDVLDSSQADAAGEVRLSGGTREFTRIEPHVLIFHRCGIDRDQNCDARVRIPVPPQYVNGPELNLGTLNLELEYWHQAIDCTTRRKHSRRLLRLVRRWGGQ